MDYFIDGFYRSFIVENRFLFILEGLRTTVILTLFSFVFGVAFGILLCRLMRAKNRGLSKFARIVKSILTEIPTLVLLMILVYIIFGRYSGSILLIVSIGLMLKAGAYLSQIFNSSMDMVALGEIEAARTLGMSRWKAFRFITLPQTLKAALPLIKNQFISTMQETSVVGYLAIMDLTKASTIVTARTMDAFFGLIVITVIYFIIGGIAKKLLNILKIRLDKHLV